MAFYDIELISGAEKETWFLKHFQTEQAVFVTFLIKRQVKGVFPSDVQKDCKLVTPAARSMRRQIIDMFFLFFTWRFTQSLSKEDFKLLTVTISIQQANRFYGRCFKQ